MSSPRPNAGRAVARPSAERVISSAVWAAWGDALGFMTELAPTQDIVRQRASVGVVELPLRWRRRVGGRFGPTVELPAGTYSDDTQLRLAVSRCIRASGRFDVETFSKIELPIFLAYGLGVGRGTRAAAHSLAKRGVRWLTNFYDDGQRYVDGGGNGAAMRIQPHVWAAAEFHPDAYLRNVVADAVATHGHPRAVVGAAFHALALAHALERGELPSPDRWRGMVRYLTRVGHVVSKDDVLRDRWLPLWEERTGRTWHDAVDDTVSELAREIRTVVQELQPRSESGGLSRSYASVAKRVGGLDPKTRGSATLTALLALWAAWQAQSDPQTGLVATANVLGSDTDTISTMAGALLGAVNIGPPPGRVADQEYIVEEARRCLAVARGEPVEDFAHPDVVHWTPPRTLADAVGVVENRVAVAGLGGASERSELFEAGQRGKDGWQWLALDFGQSVLIKRRRELRSLPEGALPHPRPLRLVIEDAQPNKDVERPQVGAADAALEGGADRRLHAGMTIADAVKFVTEANFDPTSIGTIFLLFAEDEDGLDRAAVFLGSMMEAYRQRLRTI